MCNRCHGRGTYYVETKEKVSDHVDLKTLTNNELLNRVRVNVDSEKSQLILIERGISREKINKLIENMDSINSNEQSAQLDNNPKDKELKKREEELRKLSKLKPVKRLFPEKKKKIKSKFILFGKRLKAAEKEKQLAKKLKQRAEQKARQSAEKEKQKTLEKKILKKSLKQLRNTPFENLKNLIGDKDK